jgi:serine/threonine protein kinase
MNIFTFICDNCHKTYQLSSIDKPPFCPFCGAKQLKKEDIPSDQTATSYQILNSIGKGGMGEVFLAFDPTCGRRIALKQIRSDLIDHPQIRRRFLTEAHITCQLTHPAIIPIYSIQASQTSAYYTMPYVEGETLKQIIRKTRQQEKKGESLDHIGGSIPALTRIFITICQAVAYAHSRGVIHRDLKPENIIIGKYGEVLILDWGLAQLHDAPPDEDTVDIEHLPLADKHNMTRAGKVVGTVAYMAPERAIGQPATIQTDIYSLGVILYQILTLGPPFKRGTLDEFRKHMHEEEWVDPVLAAPYRDVPRMLARFTERCMAKDLNVRYKAVDELIRDLENYIEGRSEWFQISQLDVERKEDWEFQENILIAQHVAVTRIAEESEWVSLMISKQSFAGNTKIEADVCLGDKGNGLGFLLSIPEITERSDINDGYCLWLSDDENRTTRLLRSGVEVVYASDIFLKRQQWYRIRIEKIEKTIHLYINDILQFSYIAHIPLIGTHIGLLSRDADYKISPIHVSVGNLNITVNCLAVPDAFFAKGDYTEALSEYRRIASSFHDRAEGREAIFRAGLTFIEQAKNSVDRDELLNASLNEFEKLHGTPGAPLEYLGKALVYETLKDDEEEIKCFELAYRRYPKHPLLPILQEQIISRMHEVSSRQRSTTYRFILLSIRHLPFTEIDTHTRRLFNSLQKHWEILPFIEENPSKNASLYFLRFAIPLSFWLAKPYILGEILDDLILSEQPCLIEIENTLFATLELGSSEYGKEKLSETQKRLSTTSTVVDWRWIEAAYATLETPLEEIYNRYFKEPFNLNNPRPFRSFLYFMDEAINQSRFDLVHTGLQNINSDDLSFESKLQLDIRLIWSYLLENQWQKAGEVFYSYPVELLNTETTALHFLYGCWLQATEGKEMADIHFTGLLPVTYPRTWTLASHYLINTLPPNWFEKAFLWEKRELYRHLILYYHSANQLEKKLHFQELYKEEYIHAEK